jgi:hypothetical protein
MSFISVLSTARTRKIDQRCVAIASLVGADARLLELPTGDVVVESVFEGLHHGTSGVAIHADSLKTLLVTSRESVQGTLNALQDRVRALFVYGIHRERHLDMVQYLSLGSVTGMENVPQPHAGVFTRSGWEYSRQLAGAEFPIRNSSVDVFSIAESAPGVLPIMQIGEKPFFVAHRANDLRTFLVTTEVVDPNQAAEGDGDLYEQVIALIPVLTFVRSCCEPFVWRNRRDSARLIIDDPLLRQTYGSLAFKKLFASMAEHQYGATVAFIPWNHFRTSRKARAFFSAAGDRFSVCVHGCDHTNNEYASPDPAALLAKSHLAIARMRRQKESTGIDFENIMVFPQGRFSSDSLQGLRTAGFLAAINSSRFPADRSSFAITLGDLMLPTLRRISGFPVFLRHYPHSPLPFLVDLYLQRPAFIVEHHDYFSRGYADLESLVETLNASTKELSWANLSNTVEEFLWTKAGSDVNSIDALFFSDSCRISNERDVAVMVHATKFEVDPELVTAAFVDGRPSEITRDSDSISVKFSVPARATAKLVLQLACAPRKTYHGGVFYGAGVLVRRGLSEFRDEYLMKHPALLRTARFAVKKLKVSSDTPPPQQGVSVRSGHIDRNV